MTKHTKRDKIWNAALTLGDTGKFTIEDTMRVADIDTSSERTTRDVLTTMVEMGWLEKYKYMMLPDGLSLNENGRGIKRCWYRPKDEYPDDPSGIQVPWSDLSEHEHKPPESDIDISGLL